MGFSQIPTPIYPVVFNADGEIQLASFKTVEHGELKYIRVGFVMIGVALRGGTERIRTKIYSDSTYSAIQYTSSWTTINTTNITNLADSHSWGGFIRTDFARENISKELTYYLSLEIGNYTRNADLFYCGILKDYPKLSYSTITGNPYSKPAAIQIFTYKDVV